VGDHDDRDRRDHHLPAHGALGARLIATATGDSATTLAVLFVAEALAWAGVPAIGAGGMAAAGALASQGVLRLSSVIVVATIGAEVGALAGWWIGNRGARAGLEGEHRGRFADRRERALAGGEKIADRWGPLMVFFLPSWVSGALGMHFRTFAAWNVLAAFAWVVAAGVGAYGVGTAASGGSFRDSVTPMGFAIVAGFGLVLLFVFQRRRRSSPAGEERSSAQTRA
jgi:membrane-associated protein